jgi:hypothetical protein
MKKNEIKNNKIKKLLIIVSLMNLSKFAMNSSYKSSIENRNSSFINAYDDNDSVVINDSDNNTSDILTRHQLDDSIDLNVLVVKNTNKPIKYDKKSFVDDDDKKSFVNDQSSAKSSLKNLFFSQKQDNKKNRYAIKKSFLEDLDNLEVKTDNSLSSMGEDNLFENLKSNDSSSSFRSDNKKVKASSDVKFKSNNHSFKRDSNDSEVNYHDDSSSFSLSGEEDVKAISDVKFKSNNHSFKRDSNDSEVIYRDDSSSFSLSDDENFEVKSKDFRLFKKLDNKKLKVNSRYNEDVNAMSNVKKVDNNKVKEGRDYKFGIDNHLFKHLERRSDSEKHDSDSKEKYDSDSEVNYLNISEGNNNGDLSSSFLSSHSTLEKFFKGIKYSHNIYTGGILGINHGVEISNSCLIINLNIKKQKKIFLFKNEDDQQEKRDLTQEDIKNLESIPIQKKYLNNPFIFYLNEVRTKNVKFNLDLLKKSIYAAYLYKNINNKKMNNKNNDKDHNQKTRTKIQQEIEREIEREIAKKNF